MGDRSTTIEWVKGASEPRIGVYVENLARHPYDLAYAVHRKTDDSGGLEKLETGGWWTIGPPNNKDYEAFIFSDEIQFTPGRHLFSVYINDELARSFEFTIVSPNIDTAKAD